MPGTKAIRRPHGTAAAKNTTKRVVERADWRSDTLQRVRRLIREADPAITEERKWRKPTNPAGIPVWYHDGIVCTGETYQAHVKLTFARGASLSDPAGLFNASLEGKVTRAVDLHEGEKINESAFKDLIRSAVVANIADRSRPAVPKTG